MNREKRGQSTVKYGNAYLFKDLSATNTSDKNCQKV